MNHYDGLLLKMEKQCKRIIDETADINSVLAQASAAQTRLYDEYQKASIN
jgi:hypothetical protein